MQITMKTTPRPGKAEHGQGHGNRDVYSDLPRVHFVHKLAGVVAAGGENGCTVSVRVGVDDGDGFLQSGSGHYGENRPENLLFVTVV